MATGAFSRLMAAISPRSENHFISFNNLADCAVRASKVLSIMDAVNKAEKPALSPCF